MAGSADISMSEKKLKKDGSATAPAIDQAFRDAEAGRLAALNILEDMLEYQAKLRRSEARMHLLIESATEYAIFTMDGEGSINSWNSGAERIFGYSEDEIIGKDVVILFNESDRENGMHAVEMETARRNGQALDERLHVRKDGSIFFASGVMQPLGTDASEGFVKITRDMTERLKSEDEKRERALLKALVEAQEAERRRIARDLHDELGQRLTALRLKLEGVSLSATGSFAEEMTEIKKVAKEIDEGVDFLAWELRPAALDDLGLVAAIEKYVEEWSNYSDVDSKVKAGDIRGKHFDPQVETALYRIAQESLNNVHKHAKATNAVVTLRKRDDTLVLIVDDDGVGFDLGDSAVRARGIGLMGMAERAQMIGGTFDIESQPGTGTTIFVMVPLNSSH